MLSAFPTNFPGADGYFGSPFPAFEAGFSPWESQDPTFSFSYQDSDETNLPPIEPFEPAEPVVSNDGSPYSNNPSPPNESGSGSDDPDQPAKNPADPVVDERKQRRMMSNRESARRSRMRKQKHLENLRNQVNKLKTSNRELMNRLRLVTHHGQLVRTDNDRLRSESIVLRRRLWDIRQVLLVRQLHHQLAPPAPVNPSVHTAWPCNNNTVITTSFNEETIPIIPPSLIT